MAGTRWRLVVRQSTPAELLTRALKTAVGREALVAVKSDGPDTVVSIDYDTEVEARDAEILAKRAAPNAFCFVEEFPSPDRLTRDR